MEITKTSPPTGIFRNVVFRHRVNGAGGAITADPAGDCLYMANGAFPHL